MPVGAGAGAASGRAWGWLWRPIITGTPWPMERPWKRTSTVPISKGSKTTSTRDPDQGGVDLESVAVQGDRGRLGHRAGLGPQESFVQLSGGG